MPQADVYLLLQFRCYRCVQAMHHCDCFCDEFSQQAFIADAGRRYAHGFDPARQAGDGKPDGKARCGAHRARCDVNSIGYKQIAALENTNDPARGVLRGVALNPGTPLEVLDPLVEQVDLVLLLAINPGWGGQKFGVETPRRLEKTRRLIEDSGRDVLLGVDGGITRGNIREVAALRPDLIVTGSAVFDGKAPAENARYMLDAIRAEHAGIEGAPRGHEGIRRKMRLDLHHYLPENVLSLTDKATMAASVEGRVLLAIYRSQCSD